MKYKVVIIDLDNTLIDFDKMEIGSLTESLEVMGITPNEKLIKDYIVINQSLWERLELGEHTKAEILVLRFKILFERFNLKVDPEVMNHLYLKNMSKHIELFEGSMTLLKYLKDQTTVVCMTNGVKSAQEAKFETAGLYPYFNQVIISDEVGVHKPDIGIFNYMIEKIGSFEKEDMIIIGDSLTSDIKGGNNFGIDTVWFNPKGKEKPESIKVDYEIKHLDELKHILI